MLTLQRCTVDTDEDLYHQLDDRTIVTTAGESPKATVRIAVPSTISRKFLTVDTITDATITATPRGVYRITGRSSYLANETGAIGEDATITLDVSPGGCKGCLK